jgi:hypothetical protein
MSQGLPVSQRIRKGREGVGGIKGRKGVGGIKGRRIEKRKLLVKESSHDNIMETLEAAGKA